MTKVWPLRFRESGDDFILTDEAGGWSVASAGMLDRYVRDRLTPSDLLFLADAGHSFENDTDLAYSSFLRRWANRHAAPAGQIGYVILVPTLRCNLACDYCQVSRAAEGATGYDWDEDTLQQTLAFLDGFQTKSIKVEFQGGEPLLRLDLLEEVRTFCRQRFASCTFVVCSNLQRVDDAAWSFLSDEDTFLSTSIDGDVSTQVRQRTHDQGVAESFFANLRTYIRRFGNDRLSALPTVDLRNPVDPNILIDTYEKFGLRSIYLRPINQQGFARHVAPGKYAAAEWSAYHRRFVQALIARNYEADETFEEFYLTHAIRRVMRAGTDNHVDLRNPNILGDGYLVVDYDGALYPTDEARMMSRVGQIDLSIGHVATGLTRERLAELNASSFNDLDPDCQHCAFQPYCGTDVIDDISRYGRVDVPRAETWFCQRHTALFDLVFDLLRSRDEKVIHSMKKWAGVDTWPAYLAEIRA